MQQERLAPVGFVQEAGGARHRRPSGFVRRERDDGPRRVRHGLVEEFFCDWIGWCVACSSLPCRAFGLTSSRLAVLEIPHFDWVTEESRNLGTLVVTFWPRVPPSAKRATEEYDVVAVEAESVLVASTRGGPASRISLPCQVVAQKATVVPVGSYYEIKLVTAGLSSPTKSRADLEVHTPLSTDELRETAPAAFQCSTCDAELVDATLIKRYNALPSEHWAELLDAWMCHQDQTLSDDLIAKGKGIKPRDDEGLVGTTYILLPQEVTRNWVTPQGEVRPLSSSLSSPSLFLPPLPSPVLGLQRKTGSPSTKAAAGAPSSGGTAAAKDLPRDARLIQGSKSRPPF